MAEKLTWNLMDVIRATGGNLIYGVETTPIDGISIDSRTTAKGDLFIAIVGAHHDGHDHCISGMRKGQKGTIINRSATLELPHDNWRQQGYFCVAVEDTTLALGDLAAYNCRRSGLPVVAITGSTGKTSTQQMTTAIMQQQYNVLAPKGNFNNEIGLPLTLLDLSSDHTMAVLELGMNHFGEIQRLAEICRPDIGMITNVGPVHLEGVGSIEGVAQAKGELMEYVKPGGTMVLFADDPHLQRLAKQCHHNTLFFGFTETADVGAEEIRSDIHQTSFTLRILEARIGITLHVPGRFMVANALSAAAAGYLMGLSLEQIREGLRRFRPSKRRLDLITTTTGIHLIDDTYNANPTSMAAALSLLSQLKGNNRGIFCVW